MSMPGSLHHFAHSNTVVCSSYSLGTNEVSVSFFRRPGATSRRSATVLLTLSSYIQRASNRYIIPLEARRHDREHFVAVERGNRQSFLSFTAITICERDAC